MRRAAVWAAVLAAVVSVVTASSGATRTTWTQGYDVSWPQCSGTAAHHVPGGSPRFVVLGLTHGAGHTANPCLAAQVAWARDRGSLIGGYLVPSYPTARQRHAARRGAYGTCHDLRCRLRNDGAAQAADALAVMRRADLPLHLVWVDVEFRSHPAWARSNARNRAVLQGVFRGLADAGVGYGVYTTSYMWHALTGGWTVDVPNWLPSGDGSAKHARRGCRRTGTGGATWLVQFTREWDEDLTCPVMDGSPGRPGPLWRYRHTSLQMGSQGRAVSALQRALRATPTGRYGATTTVGVLHFQHDHGLPATGTVDEDDWRALGAFRRHGGHPFKLARMTVR